MENNFIKSISIKKVRHLENLEIVISEENSKHLILTGMNGSGKTKNLLNPASAFTAFKISFIQKHYQDDPQILDLIN